MANNQGIADRSAFFRRLPPWLQVCAVVIVVALILYSAWQEQQGRDVLPEVATEANSRPSQPPVENEQEPPAAKSASPESPAAAASAARTIVPSQTIRNEDGKVVFRGDVDVGPTLRRIERGERLSFPNDGTTFQNREARLPRQPAGYYKEHVHPTPRQRGPGPQRIVTGKRGEIYYTPDHYRSFQRLDRE